MNLKKNTELIRQHALSIGFDACGFSRARRLDEEESRFEQWLKQGRHGSMQWMENHFEKRLDPRVLVPGARSVISVVMSYNQPDTFRTIDLTPDSPRISKYALGDDYHDVMRPKLYELFEYIREVVGPVEGRAFVDSAPVMDKTWARLSGIGWIGKNSNMLNKQLGSYYFIGELILDAEFEYDSPTTDHCGTCTRCIDACPTGAIYEPYQVDGSKCISYFTIELRDAVPTEYHSAIGNWMYGCDICQDVCPWNRKAAPGSESALFARNDLMNTDINFWEELNLEEYRKMFKGSAVKRAKFDGLKRNISIVSANVKGNN